MNAHTAVRDASGVVPATAPGFDPAGPYPPIGSPAERALVAAAQAGDHAAFEAIFGEHQTAIYNYLYRMMGSAEDAYDLTQDTFLKAYLNLDRTSDDLRVSAWLYRIATNVALDTLRHRKLVQWTPWELFLSVFHPSQVAGATDEPERVAVHREDAEEVDAILDQLHPRYRLCLLLREYHCLSYDEIAVALATTRATVKSLLFRARDEFREVYDRSDRRPGRPRAVPATGRPEGKRTYGVTYHVRHNRQKPWRAEPYDPTHPTRRARLGSFATAEEAQAAVDAWRAQRAEGGADR